MSAKLNKLNLNQALRERGRESVIQLNTLPVSAMPMVLTLDELRPNPDNPRTSRNPKYEDIKASIKARGLDTVPKVTKNPHGDDVYIFSDGGNTRYEILKELWEETQDEQFYRLHCLFKPWPGRLQCVIGHLAENEVRGNLTFIEKALGIQKARHIYEEELGKKVSLRELSSLLTTEGLPIHNSSISKMIEAIRYLYPSLPSLLMSGLGRDQVQLLLNLRHAALTLWQAYEFKCQATAPFEEVFSQCCMQFDSPELWNLDLFRDELIGRLLGALPHPSLNYDRWVLELDPKAHNRRQLFGETQVVSHEQTPSSVLHDARVQPESTLQTAVNEAVLETKESGLHNDKATPKPSGIDCARTEKKLLNQYKEAGNAGHEASFDNSLPFLVNDEEDEALCTSSSHNCTIWSLSALDDDIEHLQGLIWHLVFELAETQGCEHELLPDSTSDQACGFQPTAGGHASAFTHWLFSLTGKNTESTACTLTALLIGGHDTPSDCYLNDKDSQKLLRLLRLLRRLRQWQHQHYSGEE